MIDQDGKILIKIVPRPRWKRILRMPRVFIGHYRACKNIKAAWSLTMILFKEPTVNYLSGNRQSHIDEYERTKE